MLRKGGRLQRPLGDDATTAEEGASGHLPNASSMMPPPPPVDINMAHDDDDDGDFGGGGFDDGYDGEDQTRARRPRRPGRRRFCAATSSRAGTTR